VGVVLPVGGNPPGSPLGGMVLNLGYTSNPRRGVVLIMGVRKIHSGYFNWYVRKIQTYYYLWDVTKKHLWYSLLATQYIVKGTTSFGWSVTLPPVRSNYSGI